MIKLIITANDSLYQRLADKAVGEGATTQRATSVLGGYRQVMTQETDEIIVDMALHAADTLVELLHNKRITASTRVFAILNDGRLPVALRRLCTDVLKADTL